MTSKSTRPSSEAPNTAENAVAFELGLEGGLLLAGGFELLGLGGQGLAGGLQLGLATLELLLALAGLEGGFAELLHDLGDGLLPLGQLGTPGGKLLPLLLELGCGGIEFATASFELVLLSLEPGSQLVELGPLGVQVSPGGLEFVPLGGGPVPEALELLTLPVQLALVLLELAASLGQLLLSQLDSLALTGQG